MFQRDPPAARAVSGPVDDVGGGEAAVADHAHMRPAVRQPWNDLRMVQEVEHVVEVAGRVVQERQVEHAAPAIRQHVVQGHSGRRHAARGGDGRDGHIGGRLIVRLAVHQIHLRPVAWLGPREARLGLVRLLKKLGAEGRVAEARHALGQRQSGDLAIERVLAEGVEGQLQAEEHADRPGRRLALDRQTLGRCLAQPVQHGLVTLRLARALDEAE